MEEEKWPASRVEKLIYLIEGQRVILDFDLAKLYGVTPFNLNKAVRRNQVRFPKDFVFMISPQEVGRLIFQSGISKQARGLRNR
ncbi:MAG: ORF6N domain-containing protein [Candidatus Erginobacter occultus]|nr:ORF6N domain-containing protein [Candidatus Erginobacter occultus]